jgi:hypothetical protein
VENGRKARRFETIGAPFFVRANKREQTKMTEKTRRVSALPRVHPDKIDQTFDQTRMDGVRLLKPREETGPDVECCVCNGRTVHAPAADGSKRHVGFNDKTGLDAYALVQETFGPGQHITLKQSEFERLRDLGFVCAPQDYKSPPEPKDEAIKRYGPREA